MADDDTPADDTPDAELTDAVEDALDPARHDAVMSVWQQVVLGRLDHPRTSDDPGITRDVDELRRRIDEDEPPEEQP